MKSLVRWIAVLGLVGTLASCGLPGAVARTATNTVKSVGGMAKTAASNVSNL